jgi:diguanylate cyclase (GGDEF)-like protein
VVGGREYVAVARPFDRTPGELEMAAVLGYSLDEALGPFRSVTTLWVALVVLGLVVGVFGALLIARGVARPVEALADAATRVAAGDYTAPPPPADARDELGRLATAFSTMTAAIGEREERIRFQAQHDAVTGLPNRNAAEARIARAIAVDATPAALLMVGLARLPDVVKSMGHAMGDRLMREAGARLQALGGEHPVARASDAAFLLWLPRAGRAEAINLAFRVRDALGQPFHDEDAVIDAAPAVGIALFPDHGDLASALLQHADVALTAALGLEDPVSVYAPEHDPNRPERLALMGELRTAIDDDVLEVHYQPRLDLASGRITGVEGLVRWPHPLRGYVPPDAFVPLAEKSGNVRRLTRWVLATGIAQAQRWRTQARDLRVALNLSARDVDDVDLPRRVAELLAAHGLPPEQIVLEVTESAVMGEPDAAIGVLRRLADQGIDIAIDDFGVGQSSLAYLRRLPVRELKVDRSFVRGLGHDAEDRAIVRAIVDLGHRLGFRVTSEGVEDAAALAYLREIGCDHAQGYLIGRPLPVAELERWVDAAAGAVTH